jgi:hypothetical protein
MFLLVPVAVQGQDAPALGNLAAQPGWAAFGVVNGRLAVLEVPPRFEKQCSCADPEGRVSESICVKSAGHVAAVHYEFTSPEQRFTLQAIGGEWMEIHHVPQQDMTPVELHLVQAPGKDLVLTIGSGEARREFSAPTFWHLMLAEPDVTRDCLLPLLETLRPRWELRRQAAAVEARLQELAAQSSSPEIEKWETLVKELADTRFLRREAADRQLRSEGQSLYPFLLQLEHRRLDAEQRTRLEAIRRSLGSVGEDTPPRTALRMLYDETTWLTLLSREDATQRAIAARHLCKLCPAAVNFDPLADQAVRRVQLKQLRQQLAHD